MSTRADATDGIFWGDADPDVVLQRSRALLETVDRGIYQLDADGRFVAVNDALEELTGYSRANLVGEDVSVLFDEDAIESVRRDIAELLRAGGDDDAGIEADADSITDADVDADSTTDADAIVTAELVVDTADGGPVPCELRTNPLVDGDEYQGTIGIVRPRSEPTQRRESTESESESESEPYESVTPILDEANIGVIVFDEEFEVAWTHATIEQYFGLDQDSVLGRDKRDLIDETVKQRFEDPDRFAETVLATYDDNSYVERFDCHITAGEDREERWLEHYSKPIESGRYAGGRIELYYDITDRKQSEGALRETEERFQSLVDAVEEYAIFRLDPNGNVISWNEGANAIKGYDADEILGEHFSTFYTSTDQAADVPERNLERALEGGSVEDEGWRIRKDGSRFWANVTITAVRGDDGTHRGFLKVTRDMTDRYEREQELENELQRIFGRISDGFYALDEDLHFTHVNSRAEDILDVDRESLLGGHIWDAFPDLEGTTFDRQYREAMDTQEPGSFEEYYAPTDGWFEVHVYPSETGLSVYFRDVTDRIERERELERTERRFEAIFNDPNILVGLLEPDGTVLDINGTAMEYVDADLADVTGELFWETPWWGEGDGIQADVRRWTERAADGEYVEFEADLTRPNGDQYTLNGNFRPVTNDDGDVVSIIVSDRDITERKERERELERSNERLEQFAYATSHDLQEPLRMVSSYLRLVEDRYADELDEDGREFIEFAVDGADRMRDMIEALLEYSRVETRGEPLEPVELNDVLEDVLENLQLQIEEHDAEISVDDLPRVEADASQLRQVFQNLISNGIEYSGDELPRITVSAQRDGDRWTIAVRDDGIGIDPEDQERIFEVFERLHSREDHPGTGIGLALCQRIIERHGGEISVDSEPGEGSTFSVTLPPAA